MCSGASFANLDDDYLGGDCRRRLHHNFFAMVALCVWRWRILARRPARTMNMRAINFYHVGIVRIRYFFSFCTKRRRILLYLMDGVNKSRDLIVR